MTGHDHVIDADVRWGLGPQIDDDGYGMGGVGGCVGYHDRGLGLSIGFTTPRVGPLDRLTRSTTRWRSFPVDPLVLAPAASDLAGTVEDPAGIPAPPATHRRGGQAPSSRPSRQPINLR